jgi:hypothetical protein
MTAYLVANPPAVQQFYKTRNRPLTGCTVLHTSESVMDSVGPDTGAENVANFIRTRTTPGSYHDLCDSDSYINLVPYQSGAFHDGTGSNNWALSISFACRTVDWRAMTPAKRSAFLAQGARAFAAQHAWRRANGYPTTELRLITKAQSDAGMSGFIYHGLRDPGRRSDPGVAAPNEFPFAEWLDHARAAIAPPPVSQEDPDMAALFDTRVQGRNLFDWMVHTNQRLDQLHGKVDGITAVRADLAAIRATLATVEGDTSDIETGLDEVMAKLDALAAPGGA